MHQLCFHFLLADSFPFPAKERGQVEHMNRTYTLFGVVLRAKHHRAGRSQPPAGSQKVAARTRSRPRRRRRRVPETNWG